MFSAGGDAKKIAGAGPEVFCLAGAIDPEQVAIRIVCHSKWTD